MKQRDRLPVSSDHHQDQHTQQPARLPLADGIQDLLEALGGDGARERAGPRGGALCGSWARSLPSEEPRGVPRVRQRLRWARPCLPLPLHLLHLLLLLLLLLHLLVLVAR